MKIIKIFFLNMLIFFVFISCGSRGSKGDGVFTTTPKFGMNGAVQKGPFVSGSTIFIQELDDNLISTGTSYQTTTTDDFGSFEIGSNIKTRFIEVMATGYYFNEVSGSLSPSTLTLRAVSDLNSGTDVNVNILTTLEVDRIKYLILSEGKTFSEAKTQVESEILDIFNIPATNITSFDKMDISEEGDSNAILLAISSIMQADNTVAELSELLSKINLDIKGDGTLDTASLQDEIKDNSMYINTNTITTNLESRYTSLGLTVTVPSFTGFIDSDGDGYLNMDDDDVPDTATFNDVDVVWSFSTQSVQTDPLTVSGILALTDFTVDVESIINKNGSDVGEKYTQVENGDVLIIKNQLPDIFTFGFNQSVSSTVTFGSPSNNPSSSTINFTAVKPTVAQEIGTVMGGNISSVDSYLYFAHPFIASSTYTARYVITPITDSDYPPVEVCIYSDNADKPDTSLGCTPLQWNIVNTPSSTYDITVGGTYSVSSTNARMAWLGTSGVSLTIGSRYWLVMKMDQSRTVIHNQPSGDLVDFAGRRGSNDGSTWLSWTDSGPNDNQAIAFAILEIAP